MTRVVLCQFVHRHPVARVIYDIDLDHAAGVGEQRAALGAEVFEAQLLALPQVALGQTAHRFKTGVVADSRATEIDHHLIRIFTRGELIVKRTD